MPGLERSGTEGGADMNVGCTAPTASEEAGGDADAHSLTSLGDLGGPPPLQNTQS